MHETRGLPDACARSHGIEESNTIERGIICPKA